MTTDDPFVGIVASWATSSGDVTGSRTTRNAPINSSKDDDHNPVAVEVVRTMRL
jgi:hypothetical protein